MDLRRPIVAFVVLAAVLASVAGIGPLAPASWAEESGACGCCSDCGDGCACPLPPLGDDGHSSPDDGPAGPRLDGPIVASECGGCAPVVGGASSHRLDAREARVPPRTERPLRAVRAIETRPSERSADLCPEISPRAPPSFRV